MNLRHKLAIPLMYVGGATTLAGLGVTGYNAYQFNEARNEAIDRITGRDKEGLILIDNNRTFDLTTPTNHRSNAEINTNQLRYREQGLTGLTMLMCGSIMLVSGIATQKKFL